MIGLEDEDGLPSIKVATCDMEGRDAQAGAVGFHHFCADCHLSTGPAPSKLITNEEKSMQSLSLLKTGGTAIR